MSMTLTVVGFKPPTAQYQLYAAVYAACEQAGIPVPEEVVDFFGGEAPDPAGMDVELPLREWFQDSRQGYELEVAAIPIGVVLLRFVATW